MTHRRFEVRRGSRSGAARAERRRRRWVLPAIAVFVAAPTTSLPTLAQDSNLVRARAVLTVEQELQRLARQLVEMGSYELELRRLLESEQERARLVSTEAERRQAEALMTSLQETMRARSMQRQSMRRELESLCRSVPRAQGWVGVAVNSRAEVVEQRNGEARIRVVGRPVVESVDPGSPADKAGIRSGDILIAIDGRDVERRGISFNELQPESRLPFTVLRGDGETRTLVVKVERRPDALNQAPCPWLDARIAAALAPTLGEYQYEIRRNAPRPVTGGVGGAMAARTRSRSDDSTAATVATRAPVAGTMYGTAPFTVYPATGSAVAGLQLSRLSGTDLADLIGVSEGLFVDAVAPGTLGYRSGLRRHDVLLTANDSVLTAVLVLQRIVNRSRDREVKLEILRGRERRTLWLRW